MQEHALSMQDGPSIPQKAPSTDQFYDPNAGPDHLQEQSRAKSRETCLLTSNSPAPRTRFAERG